MKKILIVILIFYLLLFLTGCSHSQPKMLPDLRCTACGGEYNYDHTFNLWGNTFYYYRCQNCGKEFRTEIWRGK